MIEQRFRTAALNRIRGKCVKITFFFSNYICLSPLKILEYMWSRKIPLMILGFTALGVWGTPWI